MDALPGETFIAKVGTLSGLASRQNWYDSATTGRTFDVTFSFEQPDPRLKAGVSARMIIEGKQLTGTLHVPRQAVFAKAGKNHVFAQGRRTLRAARGQGHAADREPRRARRA